MRKLVALSPACFAGRAPLTREELHAKAAVLVVVTQHAEAVSEPNEFERAYVSFFAQETTDYLASLSKAEGASNDR